MRKVAALAGAVCIATPVWSSPAEATCVTSGTSSTGSSKVCVIDVCIGDPEDIVPDPCIPAGYCPDPIICYES